MGLFSAIKKMFSDPDCVEAMQQEMRRQQDESMRFQMESMRQQQEESMRQQQEQHHLFQQNMFHDFMQQTMQHSTDMFHNQHHDPFNGFGPGHF